MFFIKNINRKYSQSLSSSWLQQLKLQTAKTSWKFLEATGTKVFITYRMFRL